MYKLISAAIAILIAASPTAQAAEMIRPQITALLRGEDDLSIKAVARDAAGSYVVAGTTRARWIGTARSFQPRSKAASNVTRFSVATGEIIELAPLPDVPIEFAIFPGGSREPLFAEQGLKRHRLDPGKLSFVHLSDGAATYPWLLSSPVPGAGRVFAVGFLREVVGERFLQSTDGGESWEDRGPVPPGQNQVRRIVQPVWPSEPCWLFNGTATLRTRDCGASWEVLRPPGGGLSGMHPASPRRLYLIHSSVAAPPAETAFSRSEDGGETWKTLGARLPPGARLFADPANPNGVFASVDPGGRLFRSFDRAETWREIPNPAGRSFSLQAIDFTTNAIYFQSDGHLFVSTDGLATARKIRDVAPIRMAAGGGYAYFTQNTTPDCFIAKFSPNGDLIFFTYLGGEAEERLTSLAVDPAGDIYVSGWSVSKDFPTTSEIVPGADGFVAKLSADGSRLIFSTRVPLVRDFESFPPSTEPTLALAPDDGSIYVLGNTRLTTLPIVGSQLPYRWWSVPYPERSKNTYLLRLAPDGRQVRFLAPVSLSNAPFSQIAAGSRGTVYVAVGVSSLKKIDTDSGREVWSQSFLLNHWYTRIEILPDNGGLALLSRRRPLDNPGLAPFAYEWATVARVDSETGAMHSLATLSGERDDIPGAALMDREGNFLFAGTTRSRNFPTMSILETPFDTFGAAFLAKLRPDAACVANHNVTCTGGMWYSTILNWFTPAAIFSHPEGGYVMIGSGKTDDYGADADAILMIRFHESPATLPRIDSVVGQREGGVEVAFALGRWITIHGEGLGMDPRVLLDDTVIAPSQSSDIGLTFTVPETAPTGIVTLAVETADGRRSNDVRIRIYGR